MRSKFACNDSPTRPPSIDGLPYCPDVCSVDYGRCIAADYTPRQCLDFANKGFLCKSTTTLQKCDATGFLAKQPLCPGQMRFVSCMSCTPTCETPNPATCGGDCAPGCQCPPDTPIWDEAIASCVVQDDCPREGDCDQARKSIYCFFPHRESAREHWRGAPTPPVFSRGTAACDLLAMLTAALLMTSSRSEGHCQELPRDGDCGCVLPVPSAGCCLPPDV